MKSKLFCIKAVMFDFDGTLTSPGAIDFPTIKRSIGCPPESLLLEYIQSLPDKNEQKKLFQILDNYEIQAASQSKPNKGAENLIEALRSKGLKIGIITRNSRRSVIRALKNFKSLRSSDFDIIITRDDPIKPKPNGNGLILAAEYLNVEIQQIMIVGDFHLDIQAGNHAGAITVYLDAQKDALPLNVQIDFTIHHLCELENIIDDGLPLPAGKLPNRFLENILTQFHFEDPSLLTLPGVGEDTAAVSVKDEDIIVLKSDPITFATQNAGYYSVLINANDIATSGATPRWFLTTLLFPIGSTPHDIRQIIKELYEFCCQWKISLCGGHTEITDSVSRPIIIGMMAGTVAQGKLIEKRNMAEGDRILLTKKIAVEGTAIIAGEFGKELKNQGITHEEISESLDFLSDISILKEAKIAASNPGVSAMHDITEGGIATAIDELSFAGNHMIQVDVERIPVYSLTEKICQRLKIDPMGLIGSGSLLISCREESHQELMNRLIENNIHVSCIGRVGKPGREIEAYNLGERVNWPKFEADEITRLFS